MNSDGASQTRMVDDALADFQSTLEVDGFGAEWDVDDAGVHFRILATDAACMECLVPRTVVETILADALTGTGHSLADVQLPTGQ